MKYGSDQSLEQSKHWVNSWSVSRLLSLGGSQLNRDKWKGFSKKKLVVCHLCIEMLVYTTFESLIWILGTGGQLNRRDKKSIRRESGYWQCRWSHVTLSLGNCAVGDILQEMFKTSPSTQKNLKLMQYMKRAYITASFDYWLSFPVGVMTCLQNDQGLRT